MFGEKRVDFPTENQKEGKGKRIPEGKKGLYAKKRTSWEPFSGGRMSHQELTEKKKQIGGGGGDCNKKILGGVPLQ